MIPREIHIAPTSNNNSQTSLIVSELPSKPLGIRLFGLCFQFKSQQNKRTYYKVLVLLLTFIAYAAFHMGRRPLSIVKNVLNRNCSALPNTNSSIRVSQLNQYKLIEINIINNQNATFTSSSTNECSWAPFDNDATADQLLAILDSAFLLSYALFMFLSGIAADRMNLRYLISLGLLVSGLGLIAFGLAYPLHIHNMTYFIIIQIITGAAQTTGWPVAVTCISNWFGPAKRGLIYGLWNSHTSLGNILGALIAGFFVEKDWGLSFIVPGIMMITVSIFLFLFLVPTQQDVNLNTSSLKPGQSVSTISSCDISYQSVNGLKNNTKITKPNEFKAVSFLTALAIPGVVEYSLCLFFSKLVSYTFLYWLPRYITSSTSNDSESSAYLSTPFDVGGIAGAILAGYLSDKFNLNGITCNVMLVLAIPSMFIYQQYGTYSSMHNILLQLLVGSLVNGPYCLITTSISADLGDLIKDGRAMATVTAIIDGMGSIGAVLGPLLAGFASNSDDWQAVFRMLMCADVLASLCLIRVTSREIKEKWFLKSQTTTPTTFSAGSN